MARLGYVALPCVMVTPVVDVVSVALMALSFAQPLFLTAMLRLTHSFLLMTPLLLPLGESSIVTPFDCRFELPLMQKFWLTVPPAVGDTLTVAGDADVQLRSESVAVAV